MKRTKSGNVAWALFQALAILLILFNSPPAHSYSKNNSTSTALLCIAPSPVVVSREADTSLPFSLSPLQVNLLLEKNWRLTTLLHTSELQTCSALKIPSALYNTYYRVLRIHAP
jgi:hypothetical protein